MSRHRAEARPRSAWLDLWTAARLVRLALTSPRRAVTK